LSNLPIAIFAYNRPDNLKRLLASLSNCDGFDEAELTIFIDGPRTTADEPAVAQTRAIAHGSLRPNWKIQASDVNRGLRASISKGVTEICTLHGRVIVLEDDLVLSPVALRYFQAGLDKYADNPRVWSICGYMFESATLAARGDCFFLPYGNPWGWATWSRAWSQFDPTPQPVSDAVMKSPSFRTFMDVAGLYPLTDMLALAQKKLINSWYIQWHRKIVQEGGLCLFPSLTYIANTGVGRGGTHASALNPYNLFGSGRPTLAQGLMPMPDHPQTDYLGLDAARISPEKRLHALASYLGGIRRHLKMRKASKPSKPPVKTVHE
jgi:hypothetical protein